jgi:membrane protein
MLSLISALNRAFDAPESRNMFIVQGIALALALHVILFAVCALLLVVAIPVALTLVPLGSFQKAAANGVQWSLLIGLEFTLLAALYRFAPANRARCPWMTPGAVLATALWLVASALFSLNAEISARYNQVYGSNAGVVVLLTWLYISFYVVLLGAELNAALAAEREAEAQPPIRPEPNGLSAQ